MNEGTIAQNARDQLESILEAIPEPAALIGRDRRILATNQSCRAVFTSGREVCGRSCFEVLHAHDRSCGELAETCPLDCCAATGARVRALHVHAASQGQLHTDVVMRPLLDEAGRAEAYLAIVRPLASCRRRVPTDQLVGVSPAFDRALGEVERLAGTEGPVLVVGEPGTGKELFARVLHALGRHGAGAFVPVDCGSLPPSRSAGAPAGDEFRTGATAGELRAAATGGVLFLKEIEALAPAAQDELLDLFEDGHRPPPAPARRPGRDDTRLVCSSCFRPEELVRESRFHADLLAGFGNRVLQVPALRERLDDLPILVAALLSRIGSAAGRRSVDPATFDVLRDYPFPGNLRELAGVLERACVMAGTEVVLPTHLPATLRRRSADARRRRTARLRQLHRA